MSYTKTKGWGIASQGAVSTHGISPPEGVAAGDRVLVDSVATDDFATHDNEIAEWTGAAWVFSAEIAVGDTVFVESESKNFVYTGTSWTSTGGGGGGGGSAPIARSFLVEFNGANFEIDEVPNANAELLRGFTYEFIDALLDEGPDHPFIISTTSEGAALATSLPSDPEDYDYYVDGDNIIFRPSHDAAITSYYYHCENDTEEGGTILLSTLGEHDEGGGAIINPYVFTQGNDGIFDKRAIIFQENQG